MAWTSEEEKRIQKLENAIATHASTFNNVASKKQLSQLLALLKKDNQTLTDRITKLEAQLAALTAK